MTDAPIRLHGLGKRFGPVTVLRDINLDIHPGEVLGILGENGAGKSTLLKLISGVYQPSVGQIEIDGRRYDRLDPIRARQLGIAMIPQEFNLVPTLSVYENVYLGQELRRKGWLNHKQMREETARVLASLDCDLDPRAPIAALSVAEKQMVEVARVLVNDARVVILDEPTTVLTDREVEVLFKVVRALQKRGVAVLFISHKLKEVKNLCQRLLILRDGSPVELCDTANLDEEAMARKMVGRELSQVYPDKGQPQTEVALSVAGLSVAGQIDDVSFDLRRGEILGLSGLVGSGRTEIAEAIMGLRQRSAGAIHMNGKACDIRSPSDAHQQGLAYLSEDRQGRGLVMNFNLIENMTLLSLQRYVTGLISHRRERERAEHYQQAFNIRAASLKSPVGQLSGGNQQKVYLAKLLDIEPSILMLDEPTRGIDVGTKREIYRLIRQLADEGRAVLVISSELEEIIGLCDRVLVVREGRIAAELSDAQINEEDIMLYAAGARERTPAGVHS
ncbi:ABC transporter ATP-binding protein [Saccharospirillum sp. MSK14-1]|uniref:sugar ABC transporter ATP-binding protein n=1 Tax=Saccharospirillum sp. MSK14-1 TaxID=1897632 RepID=UPI000D33EBF5|nr:sugar ABC transporter ATP-binding protein [Saccharospirillum sp. MSK14-1]PTY35772.1 ABC transporter ATP-binding protein [Saccharospirillum sp. MSK14-1]